MLSGAYYLVDKRVRHATVGLQILESCELSVILVGATVLLLYSHCS